MILRCRWNDSPVTTVYRNFLKTSQNVGLIALRDRQQKVPSLRDIPSQLPNSPPLSSRDLSLKRSRPIIDDIRGYRPSQRRLHDDNLHEHGRFTGHFDQVSMPSHRFDERQHFGPHHGRRRRSQPSCHTRHCKVPIALLRIVMMCLQDHQVPHLTPEDPNISLRYIVTMYL